MDLEGVPKGCWGCGGKVEKPGDQELCGCGKVKDISPSLFRPYISEND